MRASGERGRLRRVPPQQRQLASIPMPALLRSPSTSLRAGSRFAQGDRRVGDDTPGELGRLFRSVPIPRAELPLGGQPRAAVPTFFGPRPPRLRGGGGARKVPQGIVADGGQ